MTTRFLSLNLICKVRSYGNNVAYSVIQMCIMCYFTYHSKYEVVYSVQASFIHIICLQYYVYLCLSTVDPKLLTKPSLEIIQREPLSEVEHANLWYVAYATVRAECNSHSHRQMFVWNRLNPNLSCVKAQLESTQMHTWWGEWRG